MRQVILFILTLLAFNNALGTTACPEPETVEELITRIEKAYEKADVVFTSKPEYAQLGNTVKLHSIEVWKGTVGLEPYIYDRWNTSLIFAKRTSPNAPLTYTGRPCGITEDVIIEILNSLYGEGHPPDPNYEERPNNLLFYFWPLFFSLLAVTVISFVIYTFTNNAFKK